MRVLVVGGSGFVGRHLVRALSTGNNEVTAIYRGDMSFEDYAKRHGVLLARVDLLKSRRRWNHEIAVYLAGNSNHSWSIHHPLDDLELNLVALHHFLKDFSGKLIFISSAAVYEGHTGLVHPGVAITPSLPYAISKFASERYIEHYSNVGKISGFLILRLYYAFGPGERRGRLVDKVCRDLIIGHKRTFPLTSESDSLVDALYIDDVIQTIVRAVTYNGRINVMDICGGVPLSVRDLVVQVAKHFGKDVKLVTQHRKTEFPIRFWSDPRAARAALKVPPPVGLIGGIERYLAWMKSELGSGQRS